MLFAQLEKYGIDIHVNIAGIIIEKDPDSLKNRFEIRNHLHVMDNEESNEGNQNYGFSTNRFSIFDQRAKRVNRNNMKVAGSIVQHPKHVQNYVVAARELAHLMEIDYETTENLFGNDAQCPGLMQKHNIRCLKWSDKNIESFKKYFSKSLNRCFLLNHPTSLSSYNKPVELISPAKMCACYAQKEQHHSEVIKSIAVISEKCSVSMVCFKPDDSGVLKKIARLPLPVDGTKCGENKVCFRRKCIETSVENRYKDS
ncbi:hypothetical protein PV326_004981 [Microctonus aethiopoides]|nr:hypothetical protein PV326_004981 [Microctonus aethiopoides]